MDNSWNALQYNANEKKEFHNNGGLLRQDENTQSKCTNICKIRKTLIDKMKINNEVINKLNETHSNQQGLYLSIILTVLYASMYFIFHHYLVIFVL